MIMAYLNLVVKAAHSPSRIAAPQAVFCLSC
jgi:hypothetical protein